MGFYPSLLDESFEVTSTRKLSKEKGNFLLPVEYTCILGKGVPPFDPVAVRPSGANPLIEGRKYGMNYYILKDKKIKSVDQETWGFWMEEQFELKEKSERILKKNRIGTFEVSTVFLGINHNFLNPNDPILFETMIFPECKYCVRSRTYDDALKEHEIAVAIQQLLYDSER